MQEGQRGMRRTTGVHAIPWGLAFDSPSLQKPPPRSWQQEIRPMNKTGTEYIRKLATITAVTLTDFLFTDGDCVRCTEGQDDRLA